MNMKRHFLMTLMLIVCSPCLWALTVSVSRTLNITDDDSVTTGDALYDTTPDLMGVSSAQLSSEGQTASLGYRFSGANSGRGISNTTQQVRSITQNIDVSVTWILTSDSPGEIYSFTLNPSLNGYLNVLDEGANEEANDESTISNFNATLSQNGNTFALNQLGLTGGSRTSPGSSNVNDSASRTFANLSGDHTFILQYSGSTTAAWKIAGFQDNRTANAVLWGQDGTMNGDSFPDTFDNYATAADLDNDGLFVQATAELIVIPELSSLVLAGLAMGVAGLLGWRRRTP